MALSSRRCLFYADEDICRCVAGLAEVAGEDECRRAISLAFYIQAPTSALLRSGRFTLEAIAPWAAFVSMVCALLAAGHQLIENSLFAGHRHAR